MLHGYHVLYSVRYYPQFHVTAVGLGTYYPWIRGHTVYIYIYTYMVIKKSLCTWWKTQCIRTIPTQLMIWRWPSQNTFGMWTVLYWTRSSRTQFGVSINVWRMAWDTLNITCNFLYCNHQVHRDFLITLHIYIYIYIYIYIWVRKSTITHKQIYNAENPIPQIMD
jgi:hypothetical protein